MAWVIWLTGLSASGKTTLAEVLAERIRERGLPVEVLDGDVLRDRFPGTGFTREERSLHIQRVAFMASRLEAHGVTCIVSLISPYREARQAARAMCARFVEVHVSTPLEVCEARDPKGLYAKARAGLIAQFTGISDPYEPPLAAEVTIDTSQASLEEAVARVLAHL